MLKVYLTDVEKWVTIELGQGQQDIAFVMRLKKIFLSTADLLEPVLPDDNDITKLQWRTTEAELQTLQRLANNWQQLELRLRAYAAFAGKDAMDIIVQVARQQRTAQQIKEQQLNEPADIALLSLDLLMLYSIHQQLDQLLLREKPFTQAFLQEWPAYQPPEQSSQQPSGQHITKPAVMS